MGYVEIAGQLKTDQRQVYGEEEKRVYTKKQKALAFLTCAVIIITTLFSIFFIVKEADHDCTGEGCQACACIRQAEQVLKQLGTGLAETAVSAPASAQSAIVLVCVFLFVCCTTLISQKVRLND